LIYTLIYQNQGIHCPCLLLNESYADNTTELLEEFNTTLMQFEDMYQGGAGQHQGIVDEIEEEYGDFFNPNRKIP